MTSNENASFSRKTFHNPCARLANRGCAVSGRPNFKASSPMSGFSGFVMSVVVYGKGNLRECSGSKSGVGEAMKQGDRAVLSTVREREKLDLDSDSEGGTSRTVRVF